MLLPLVFPFLAEHSLVF